MSIQLKKWDERLMRVDDGLGFRKNWGRALLEDYVLRVFLHRSKRWGLRSIVGESFFFNDVDFLRGGVVGSMCRSFSLYFEWRSNLHNDHTSPALELVLACKSHVTPKSWVLAVGCHPFRVPKAFFKANMQSFLLTLFFFLFFWSFLLTLILLVFLNTWNNFSK